LGESKAFLVAPPFAAGDLRSWGGEGLICAGASCRDNFGVGESPKLLDVSLICRGSAGLGECEGASEVRSRGIDGMGGI
jgi:hypothetical protein